MKPTRSIAICTILAGLVQPLSMFVGVAQGEVTELRSQIMSSITEFVDGQAGSTDSSVENFPATSGQLPIETLSGLGDFEGREGSDFGARGIATFRDPSLSLLTNPGEWGVESDCFSMVPSIAYEVRSEIIEQRDIVFSEADLRRLPLPDGNRIGGFGGAGAVDRGASDEPPEDVTVLGSVFVNGGILIWSSDSSRDLAGLRVELDVTVAQVGGSSETAGDILFEGSVVVSGAANGEIRVETRGGVTTIVDGPALLLASNLGGVVGVVNELESSGRTHLIVLPGQALGYKYSARPSDPFTLEAKVSCRSVNLPGGTGVAAVFGRSFRALASVISPAVPRVSADIAQAAMNRTIAESSPPAVPSGLSGLGCGAIGFCSPLVLLCGLAASRKRW